MTINVGDTIRIRPGLRDKLAISGKRAEVIELVNDNLLVRVGDNKHVVSREQVVR
jgi:hypothetical protein